MAVVEESHTRYSSIDLLQRLLGYYVKALKTIPPGLSLLLRPGNFSYSRNFIRELLEPHFSVILPSHQILVSQRGRWIYCKELLILLQTIIMY